MALGKGLNSLIPQHKKEQAPQPQIDNNQPKVWNIPISEIVPNPEQPRKVFNHADLEDLIASIKKHGVLQPITVTEKSDGGYELIAGERRLRSSQMAGLVTIPALVRIATDQEKLELALIENIQRQNLNPIEEAFSFKRLIEEYGLTQQEVAEQVGKKRPTVANTLRLLDLPEVIQRSLIEGKISAGKARAILSLKNEQEQLNMYKSMIGEHMSVRDVESAVAQTKPLASRKGSVRRDPNIRAQEELMEERLGTKVNISKRGEKGKIIIEFYSLEELKRLLQELT
ncbi:MAG: ParB/RepB/Spo0J family partition protein [Candidatus Magasanikbacteria bacterium]|uniref:HTH cro/C1-type domain-containing protein n=1 Tax=Candidatus Magasanikbacteria bacterium CG10_big_fil_rev_8_21_14_0_10_38_6 TaxID=1974647 RepID=A0A2M6NZW0_9BACT|nr:ParB/RepB/Spo0J family partition protein [Candidatus Magasanikbacteria bacterium]NCS71876.1 ParB/RepB/Spo0J family partition protein [Candidatus Magasanikbacteria bacterium]PIR77006.1 MAG: hypothetical protein COU30_04845 [Candidatus Magasanikbacteria bacterium CG10_big_fil_rev_8_21_14_0_10_38_6]